MELASELRRRCRDVFGTCEEFDSNDQLRDLMAISSLKPFRGDVEASTKPERITRCIARLPEKMWKGQEVFLCFVDELCKQYQEGDGRRQALDQLYAELKSISDDLPSVASVSPRPLPDVASTQQVQERRVIRIFYSHAVTARDQDMVQEFLKQMTFLRMTGSIAEWHPGLLMGGAPSKDERERSLRASEIVMLMLSPDYISDPVLLQECRQALANGAWVIPVLLRPVNWQQGLNIEHLVPLPRNGVAISKWADRDTAFAEVASELSQIVKSLLSK